MVFIRYNPDNVRSNGSQVTVTPAERIDLLVATVKAELARAASGASGAIGDNAFFVASGRVVQLWFDSQDAVRTRRARRWT